METEDRMVRMAEKRNWWLQSGIMDSLRYGIKAMIGSKERAFLQPRLPPSFPPESS